MRNRRGLAGAVLAFVAVLAVTIGQARADIYLGGGTAVFKQEGQAPNADDGVLACSTNGVAVGGGCVPFSTNAFVAVNDIKNGQRVAFQVCIDNNGDGICTSPDKSRNCPDLVVFSHGDDTRFHNPLGPLPSSFLPGCGANAPWKGYVVFLCEGVHVAKGSAAVQGTPHTHEATLGMITSTATGPGDGFGNFCGGVVENPSQKRYTVVA